MSSRTLRAQSRSFQTDNSFQKSRQNSQRSIKSNLPLLTSTQPNFFDIASQSKIITTKNFYTPLSQQDSSSQVKIKRLLQSQKLLQAIVEMDKIFDTNELIEAIELLLQFTEMNYKNLQQKQSQTLIEWALRKLEVFDSQSHIIPLIISCTNNLASIFKRFGEYQSSLYHLEKAVKILDLNNHCLKGQTYLNITSVLSALGLHDRALKFAQLAVRWCKREFYQENDKKHLVFAYHNYAVELEHTKQFNKALIHHQKATECAQELFGADDKLTKILRDAMIRAQNAALNSQNQNDMAQQKSFSKTDNDELRSVKIDNMSLVSSTSKFEQAPKFRVIKQNQQVLLDIKQKMRQNPIRPNNFLEDDGKLLDVQSATESKYLQSGDYGVFIAPLKPQVDFQDWTDSDEEKKKQKILVQQSTKKPPITDSGIASMKRKEETQLLGIEQKILLHVESSSNFLNKQKLLQDKKNISQENSIQKAQELERYSISEVQQLIQSWDLIKKYLLKESFNEIQIYAQIQANYISDTELEPKRVSLSSLMQGHMRQILCIQSGVRKYQARQIIKLKWYQIVRKAKTIKTFSLNQNAFEYGLVFVSVVAKNDAYLRCYHAEQKALSNSLQIHKVLTKFFGKPDSSNFNDMFELDYRTNQLSYSEICLSIIERNYHDNTKPSATQINNSAILIQRFYRRFALSHKFRFVTRAFIRNMQPEGQTHHIVGRKVVIQDVDGLKRCLLLVAHLYVTQHQPKMINLISKTDFNDTDKQVLIVKCSAIDQQNDKLKISPFNHKLYEPPSFNDIISMVKVILDKCLIFKNKRTGQWQVSTQNIDEIQTSLTQQAHKSMGNQTNKQEKTLQARIALQTERFHKRYFNNANTQMAAVTSEQVHEPLLQLSKFYKLNKAVLTIQDCFRKQRAIKCAEVMTVKDNLMIKNNLSEGQYIQNQSILSTYTFQQHKSPLSEKDTRKSILRKSTISMPKTMVQISDVQFSPLKLINEVSSQVYDSQPPIEAAQLDPIIASQSLMKMILRVQSLYRAKETQKLYQIKLMRNKQLHKCQKIKGILVLKSYMRLQDHLGGKDQLVLTNMYSKQQESKESIIIEVIFLATRRAKLQGYVVIDTRKTLKFQSYYQALLQSIRLHNDQIIVGDVDQFSPLKECMPELQASPTVETMRVESSSTPMEPKLVYNLERCENGEDMIYNVIYSGSEPLTQYPPNNGAHLNVNLTQLMRLYPDLDVRDKSLMTTIGEQLIEGIRMRDGQIFVNEAKIKQNVLVVDSIDIPKTLSTFVNSQRKIILKKKDIQTLVKYTKYFNKAKFLITINYEERPIARIVRVSNDETFQEYEAVYEVSAQNLSQESVPHIQWFVTSHEAYNLCKTHSRLEVARYIMKRTQIVGHQFLLVLDSKEDLIKLKSNKNVVCIVESTIRLIQGLLPKRRSHLCRKLLKEELNTWRGADGKYGSGMYVHCVSKLASSSEFIVVCGEMKDVPFGLIAWSLNNFKRYSHSIPKSAYQQFNNDRKKKREFAEMIVEQYTSYNELNDAVNVDLPEPDDLINYMNN